MNTPKFELLKTMVLFSHMNLRQEKHGEESALAVDLKLSLKTTNDVLAMFHPSLKSRLFKKPEGAGDLVAQAGADELVSYCFPQMESIRWAHEQYNTIVRFPIGLTGKKDIVLDDAKINAFVLACYDGGTVEVTWRVQSAVTPAQIEGLSERLETGKVDIEITYVEPEEAQQILTNDPVQNPIQAANDEDDEEELDARPAFVERGRGRGRS